MRAMDGQLRLGTHDRTGIRGGGDHWVALEGWVHWQAEQKIHAIGLAEFHEFGPGIVAVAAQQDAGVWPMAANAPDQTAHMGAVLGA